MILILDLDRTLNRLFPIWVRSIRELAPPTLREENGRAFWDWIIDHLSAVDYPPHEEAVETVRLLATEASSVVINTGRPQALRQVSERWIARFLEVDDIWMRGDDDFRPTAEVKMDNLQELVSSHACHEIFAFDDNQAVLEAYGQTGINTFWAPRCWDGLLYSIRNRSAGESVITVLKRYNCHALKQEDEDQAR